MTQEDKELLLKDICARLPYKVIVEFVSYKGEEKPWFGELSCKDLDCFIHDVGFVEIKPYLFPLSSMTEEQKEFIKNQFCYDWDSDDPYSLWTYCIEIGAIKELYDWLNKNHFDHGCLIPRGLAIDATGLNIY